MRVRRSRSPLRAELIVLDAVTLQECLDDELRGRGVDLRPVDAHDPADLAGLRDRARGVEATLVRFIESGGGTITRYPDVEAFLTAHP